ncbi:tripartite tricarboxylate transporter permease [Thalassobaculum sp. OXR-137]|uniref:tripartite tricarboxylate transporter permease n=1 Tax=Thalassobaculum sp. OXR-137 TaxID=3100173 RepID=UPI002AC8E8CD|nr:tripartite tricarboxylate transporter permease [Thalassobaculum sp. OXR-137]WPZ32347.1 tripartite tricarboxylate transporter permease [Thalassobaculum sp. OXR-137]
MIDYLAIAAGEILTPTVIGYIIFGVLIGYIVGALPGMNRTTAIALAIPFTFTMPPAAALSFLIGINKGGAAGAAVSAILLNVPGEPSAVVTTYDGYPMTKQGKAQKALVVALVASVVGDLLATVVLILLAQPVARFAIGLGPIELASILIFSITFIAAVSGDSFFKALIAGILGLLLSAPGIDIETGLPRMTFGLLELYDGIPLLAVAIGTLALSEILVQIDEGWRGDHRYPQVAEEKSPDAEPVFGLKDAAQITPSVLRGSLVGTLVGILPGFGATLASFLAYTWVRQSSKTPEAFGKGAPEGVAASESADNATVPAALIPVFAIGVPGSLSTALLMGAFMMHGLTPGPFLFKESGSVVYGIYLGMLLASAALLLVGLFGQRIFSAVIQIRKSVLLPVIVFLCIVGAYMEAGGMFGVYLMLIFGFVGYFMKKFDYSFVTFVVGYVLGPMAELTIRQSLIISDANPAVLIDHPIAILFLLLAVFSIWRFAIAGARSMQIDRPGGPT